MAVAATALLVSLLGISGSKAAPASGSALGQANTSHAEGRLGGRSPTWSPDGTRIAYAAPLQGEPYLTHADRIIVMNARDGSGKRTIFREKRGQRGELIGGLRWVSSRRIVWDRGIEGSLYATDPTTSRTVRLGGFGTVIPAPSPGTAFEASPNGELVAYNAPPPGGGWAYTIGVMRAAGGQRSLIPHPANTSDLEPAFSPDGKRLIFLRQYLAGSPRAGESTVIVRPIGAGRAHELPLSGSYPHWSPDGRWIAAIDLGHRGLKIMRSTSGDIQTVLDVDAYAWSPDSRRIAYVANGALGTVTLDGKTITFVLGSIEPYDDPHWSPDGRRIVFAAREPAGSGVYVIEADGTRLRRLD